MKTILSIIFFLLFLPSISWAKKDSVTKPFTYFRVGLDVYNPIAAIFQTSHRSFEMQADANYSKSINLVAEAGWGNSSVNNNYITYKSSNSFLRVGIDHPFFLPEFLGDKDNATIGLRYGMGFVKRSEATFTIQDPLWGNSNGMYKADHVVAHWFELAGGFRVEVKKNIFLGWTMRMKAIINAKRFQTLPPAYMAGYGRGDKNAQTEFNLYVLYGFGKR